MEQVGKILKQKSDFPGDNLYRLYEMTLFNFIIGNVDAHLKNISLITLLIQLNNRMIWVFRILLSIQLYADLSSWKVHALR